MDNFKEFQGKTLDEAINQALSYFDCAREKLEIEIVQDAKSGIFGIVGARKAKIRARRVQLKDALSMLERPESAAVSQKKRGDDRNKNADAAPTKAESPASSPQKRPHKASPDAAKHVESARDNRRLPKPPQTPTVIDELENDLDELAPAAMETLDADLLKVKASEIVKELLRPLAGHDVAVNVEIGNGRAVARVEWEGDAGLLIGREGQTLVSIQHIASRILSKAMNAAVRIQLDIGDYRRKQDDRLRELALSLAEKARQHHRSYSTRPLSAYHRRIVHLSLQDAPDIQTRSAGEGQMKRVLISPRRSDRP